MFKKSKNGYYFWEEFAKTDGIIHGFSTRKFGNMNWKNEKSSKNLKLFCDTLGVSTTSAYRMVQVHGDRVSWISKGTNKGLVNDADSLLTLARGVFLTVTFADCVPILLLDKNKKIFGVVHAGWKGVYKEIVKKAVRDMVSKGSDASEVMVGIGPSIKACCYSVNQDRADSFKVKFPKMKGITKSKDGNIFLDLAKIVKLQLNESGILGSNILDCNLCTKDNISEFYSFRKEGGTKSFGLSAGIIGIV